MPSLVGSEMCIRDRSQTQYQQQQNQFQTQQAFIGKVKLPRHIIEQLSQSDLKVLEKLKYLLKQHSNSLINISTTVNSRQMSQITNDINIPYPINEISKIYNKHSSNPQGQEDSNLEIKENLKFLDEFFTVAGVELINQNCTFNTNNTITTQDVDQDNQNSYQLPMFQYINSTQNEKFNSKILNEEINFSQFQGENSRTNMLSSNKEPNFNQSNKQNFNASHKLNILPLQDTVQKPFLSTHARCMSNLELHSPSQTQQK
eukprot:TRINITY_DN6221_c0_g1_i3.p1 TRINITY_DN6221_c0_g1~~TRINITY_DN6221_c0_g1_i3.p1  ORF type:complete len:259 (+),score=36.57 TRINITY_DN6221_c0_g1_i3:117-893(+)